ncbi:hypothetical protein ACN6UZ_004228, partial [Cronobacter dublinensis]
EIALFSGYNVTSVNGKDIVYFNLHGIKVHVASLVLFISLLCMTTLHHVYALNTRRMTFAPTLKIRNTMYYLTIIHQSQQSTAFCAFPAIILHSSLADPKSGKVGSL